MVPFLLLLAIVDSMVLFFMGRVGELRFWWLFLMVGFFNSWGNFAPYYEISAGAIIDGLRKEVYALPLLGFSFYFYMFYTVAGFFEAIADSITSRNVTWDKTKRFEKASPAPKPAG